MAGLLTRSQATQVICRHEVLLEATDITAFIKGEGDGFFYLYSPRDKDQVPTPYACVRFCANRACERVEYKKVAEGKYEKPPKMLAPKAEHFDRKVVAL